jgi:hypothetical protein
MFSVLMEVLELTEALFVIGQKRVIASDREQQSSMICSPQAILSHFLVLK